MSNVKSVEVFLAAVPSEDFDQDLQVWLYHEYDTDDVIVHVGRWDGRPILQPFVVVWLYPHPTRSRARELEGQEAVAAAISEQVGYPVPLWAANPYRAATPIEARWAKTGELTCEACGTTFDGRTGRDGPRYCSDACRQRAWRERQATKTS